jgi:hypothetical protein
MMFLILRLVHTLEVMFQVHTFQIHTLEVMFQILRLVHSLQLRGVGSACDRIPSCVWALTLGLKGPPDVIFGASHCFQWYSCK